MQAVDPGAEPFHGGQQLQGRLVDFRAVVGQRETAATALTQA